MSSTKLVKININKSFPKGIPSKKSTKAVITSKSKYYKQKFRSCWLSEEFSPWLMRNPSNPDRPYCMYCERKLEGGISHLRRHAKSSMHRKKEMTTTLDITHLGTDQSGGDVHLQNDPLALSDEPVKVSSHLQYIPITSQISSHHVGVSTIEMSHIDDVSQHIQLSTPQTIITNNRTNTTNTSTMTTANSIDHDHLNTCPHHHNDTDNETSPPSSQHLEMKHISVRGDDDVLQLPSHHAIIVASSANDGTTDGNLFRPTVTHQTKPENSEYLIGFDDVGSSTEVTVASSSTGGGLGVPDAAHITVTIQGQDPMYIQSTAEPLQLPYTQEPQLSSQTSADFKPVIMNSPPVGACTTAALSDKTNIKQECTYKRKSKWYRQKYSSLWDKSREFSAWLTRDPCEPSSAYCLACAKRLKGGLAHLRRHADTPYHRKRMQETYKKRQLHLAQQAELSLTKYAAAHRLSDAAVSALPGLLQGLLTDSELCKMISADRMESMMLVRKECVEPRCPGIDEVERVLRHVEVQLSTDRPMRCQCSSHRLLPNICSYFSHVPPQRHTTQATYEHAPSEQQYATQGKTSEHLEYHTVEQEDRPTCRMSHAEVSQQPQSSCTTLTAINVSHEHQEHNYEHQQDNEHQEHNYEHQQDNEHHDQYLQTAAYMGDHELPHHRQQSYQPVGAPHDTTTDSIATSSATPAGVADGLHTPVSLYPHHSHTAKPRPALPPPPPSQPRPVHQPDTTSSSPLACSAVGSGYAVPGYHNSYAPLQQDSGVGRWRGRVAVVTGASAGIGAAICRSLVGEGLVVVGVARQHLRVKELAEQLCRGPGSLHAIQCDITKDDEVRAMFSQVTETFGAVHLCINNAGVSANSSLLEGSPSEWRHMLDVNVVGLCLVTQLAVRAMRLAHIDNGHIINISSMSGHRVAPNSRTHFYAATKHAVRALTEGLRQELREANSHIRVSSLSPGLVVTEFAQTMTGDAAAADKLYASLECLKADDIAATVLHMMAAPDHVEINDVLMRPTEQAS